MVSFADIDVDVDVGVGVGVGVGAGAGVGVEAGKLYFIFDKIWFLPFLLIFLKDIGFKPASRCWTNTSSCCQTSDLIMSLKGNSCDGYLRYSAIERKSSNVSLNLQNRINIKIYYQH